MNSEYNLVEITDVNTLNDILKGEYNYSRPGDYLFICNINSIVTVTYDQSLAIVLSRNVRLRNINKNFNLKLNISGGTVVHFSAVNNERGSFTFENMNIEINISTVNNRAILVSSYLNFIDCNVSIKRNATTLNTQFPSLNGNSINFYNCIVKLDFEVWVINFKLNFNNCIVVFKIYHNNLPNNYILFSWCVFNHCVIFMNYTFFEYDIDTPSTAITRFNNCTIIPYGYDNSNEFDTPNLKLKNTPCIIFNTIFDRITLSTIEQTGSNHNFHYVFNSYFIVNNNENEISFMSKSNMLIGDNIKIIYYNCIAQSSGQNEPNSGILRFDGNKYSAYLDELKTIATSNDINNDNEYDALRVGFLYELGAPIQNYMGVLSLVYVDYPDENNVLEGYQYGAGRSRIGRMRLPRIERMLDKEFIYTLNNEIKYGLIETNRYSSITDITHDKYEL